MSIIDKYLFELQNRESVFPMDSIHSGKLPSQEVITGKSEDENIEDENKIQKKEINQDELNRRI